MTDPDNPATLAREVTVLTTMKGEVVRATADEIEDGINACFGAAS